MTESLNLQIREMSLVSDWSWQLKSEQREISAQVGEGDEVRSVRMATQVIGEYSECRIVNIYSATNLDLLLRMRICMRIVIRIPETSSQQRH